MTERNDKVPVPCTCRVETGRSRFLILGLFSEVQLVAPGSQGKTVYHVFYDHNLVNAVSVTIERLTFTKAKVTRIERHDGPQDDKGKQLFALVKEVSYILPITAKTGDADLLLALHEAHYNNVHKLGIPIFNW